jgi:hypothetical protein
LSSSASTRSYHHLICIASASTSQKVFIANIEKLFIENIEMLEKLFIRNIEKLFTEKHFLDVHFSHVQLTRGQSYIQTNQASSNLVKGYEPKESNDQASPASSISKFTKYRYSSRPLASNPVKSTEVQHHVK